MHLTALGDVHGAASGLKVDDHYAAVRFCEQEVNGACYLLVLHGGVAARTCAPQLAGRVGERSVSESDFTLDPLGFHRQQVKVNALAGRAPRRVVGHFRERGL